MLKCPIVIGHKKSEKLSPQKFSRTLVLRFYLAGHAPFLLPPTIVAFGLMLLLLDCVCFLFGRRRYVSQSFKKLVLSRSRPGR